MADSKDTPENVRRVLTGGPKGLKMVATTTRHPFGVGYLVELGSNINVVRRDAPPDTTACHLKTIEDVASLLARLPDGAWATCVPPSEFSGPLDCMREFTMEEYRVLGELIKEKGGTVDLRLFSNLPPVYVPAT